MDRLGEGVREKKDEERREEKRRGRKRAKDKIDFSLLVPSSNAHIDHIQKTEYGPGFPHE